MQEVYEKYTQLAGIVYNGCTPSVVQFRWGACKGEAYVDTRLPGRCLAIRPSQRKFVLVDPTEEQLIFEVCAFPKAVHQSLQLNTQIIRAIQPRC